MRARSDAKQPATKPARFACCFTASERLTVLASISRAARVDSSTRGCTSTVRTASGTGMRVTTGWWRPVTSTSPPKSEAAMLSRCGAPLATVSPAAANVRGRSESTGVSRRALAATTAATADAAEARGERDPLVNREIEPVVEPERIGHRRHGHARRVERRFARQITNDTCDLGDPHATVRRPRGADPIAHAGRTLAEHVEAHADVADAGGRERENAHTAECTRNLCPGRVVSFLWVI